MERTVSSVAIGAADRPYLAAAASRLCREVPDCTVSVHSFDVEIRGVASAGELRRRWTVIILNERLAHDAARRQADVLETLAA